VLRYVALRETTDLGETFKLMNKGWHLVAASMNSGVWVYLLGRQDLGIPYDEESDSYDGV